MASASSQSDRGTTEERRARCHSAMAAWLLTRGPALETVGPRVIVVVEPTIGAWPSGRRAASANAIARGTRSASTSAAAPGGRCRSRAATDGARRSAAALAAGAACVAVAAIAAVATSGRWPSTPTALLTAATCTKTSPTVAASLTPGKEDSEELPPEVGVAAAPTAAALRAATSASITSAAASGHTRRALRGVVRGEQLARRGQPQQHAGVAPRPPRAAVPRRLAARAQRDESSEARRERAARGGDAAGRRRRRGTAPGAAVGAAKQKTRASRALVRSQTSDPNC